MKRTDYRLTNCLVLWAAAIGSRRAYDFAMAAMPCARLYDGNQISPEGPAQKEMAAKAYALTAKVKTTTRKTNR
jgi:hypothetical protein